MTYLQFTAYDEDYTDIHLYIYNESIDKESRLATILKESRSFIHDDLKAKGKDTSKYKIDGKLVEYKEITKQFDRYTFINKPERAAENMHYGSYYDKVKSEAEFSKIQLIPLRGTYHYRNNRGESLGL